jgi:hypothetical protein
MAYQQMAQYGPPAPPICPRDALQSCLGVYDYRGFDFCWSLRPKISRSTAISLTGLLKSQLRQVQAAQQLDMRPPARAVYRSWQPLVMWKRAYSPRHDAPSTKYAAKRAGGSEVTAFRVHHQGQCKAMTMRELAAQYGPPAPPICLRGALKSCLGV